MKTKERMKDSMNEKILKEAEAICEIMFPDNEIGQCLLHHHLALFADYVEVQSLIKFRDEMNTTSLPYRIDEVKHG